MDVKRPGLGGRSIPDHRVNNDEGGFFLFLLGFLDGLIDRLQIVSILDFKDLPAQGLKAAPHILREAKLRGPRKGNEVSVVKDDQFPQAEVSG